MSLIYLAVYDGASVLRSSPVLLTARTTGPEGVKSRGVIEQGEMTIR
jgi:hypothetical protein